MKEISLHLLDIAQNSVAAQASRIVIKIEVTSWNNIRDLLPAEDKKSEDTYWLVCEVIDNGRGIDPDFAKQVTNPFATTRTTRDVGLGIPLLKLSAEMAGGGLVLESQPMKGTTVKAYFQVNNIDRIPLGDIASTFKILILGNPDINWIIEFSSFKDKFVLDTQEVKKELGVIPIINDDVLDWIERTVCEGIKVVFGGVLDEVR